MSLDFLLSELEYPPSPTYHAEELMMVDEATADDGIVIDAFCCSQALIAFVEAKWTKVPVGVSHFPGEVVHQPRSWVDASISSVYHAC